MRPFVNFHHFLVRLILALICSAKLGQFHPTSVPTALDQSMREAQALDNEVWKSLAKLGEARIPGLTPAKLRLYSYAYALAAVPRVDAVI